MVATVASGPLSASDADGARLVARLHWRVAKLGSSSSEQSRQPKALYALDSNLLTSRTVNPQRNLQSRDTLGSILVHHDECHGSLMQARLRFIGGVLAAYITLAVALVFTSSLLILDEDEEEEGEGPGLVGGYDRRRARVSPTELLPHQKYYIENIHEFIAAYSRLAKIRRRRFVLLLTTALTCASGVPVAVAAGAPGWAAATLGALAAITQGSEQLLQDQRLSGESHAIAVLLSHEVRQLKYGIAQVPESGQGTYFEEFVKKTENILQTQGEVLLELMRHMPAHGSSPTQRVPA
jgi:hypothetical protein